MSETLSLLAALTRQPSWLDHIRPASFRGVPFGVFDHTYDSGRRTAKYQFPYRDAVLMEDLGRQQRRFTISAFVIGEEWSAARDALREALEDDDAVGTLIHPTLGQYQVRCEGFSLSETTANGGMAAFNLVLLEEGSAVQPAAAEDTAAQLRKRYGPLLKALREGFAWAFAAQDLGSLIRNGVTTWLTGTAEALGAKWLGLPGLDLRGTAAALTSLGSADPDDTSAVAAAVTAPAEALAEAGANTAGAPTSAAAGDDALGSTATTSRAEGGGADLTAVEALLAFAAYDLDAPPVPDTGGVVRTQEAANREALNDLLRGACVAAAADLLAQVDWPNADAAEAMRLRLLDFADARAEAAADAGLDELYTAWRQLIAALSTDLRERGQQAPRLATYAVPQGLPSLVLAHRLYGDATSADALVALNAVPHPAAMPAEGQMLMT